MANGAFPPFPPKGRYSPSRAYGDEYRAGQPPYPPAPGPAPSYPRPTYEPYGHEAPRPAYPYDQPRASFDGDRYDPYQPSTNGAYDPGAPQIRIPNPSFPPPPTLAAKSSLPPPPVMTFGSTIPARPPPSRAPMKLDSAAETAPELTVTTEMTTLNIGSYTAAIYSLPPSHLPIEKYIAINREDALNLHRELCSRSKEVWYSDGSSRAGEGWSAAVEWSIAYGRSDKKMRGCVGEGDALDAELGGICKAAEGFDELLQLSLKEGKRASYELVVFCDSQAAIVSIDTSSRPESLRFEQLWRGICSRYLQAHMKLVWLPRGNDIEGHILADKIAMVGASNAYLKKRKEGNLAEQYRRAGGGDPDPPGSSSPGPWQRGDADPSRRKLVFDRPVPPPMSPPDQTLPETPYPLEEPTSGAQPSEAEDEAQQPREGSIFVTHFPEQASAKDLGVLFAKYGTIVAVDIYHISAAHPRFAFVAYTEKEAGVAAIKELNRQPIPLNDEFARQQGDDLQVWKTWLGQLTVVPAEPPRLVPRSVLSDFPNLPDWALGNAKDQSTSTPGNGLQIKEERSATPDDARAEQRKRERDAASANALRSSPASDVDSPSPHKRPRQDFERPPSSLPLNPLSNPELKHALPANPTLLADARANPVPNVHPMPRNTPSTTTPLPPFPPTLRADQTAKTPSPYEISHNQHPQALTTGHLSTLPPTPNTAEKRNPLPHEDRVSPARSASMEPTSQGGSSKRPLTNSAAEPQETPIKIGAKSLRALISLVHSSFGKVDVNNWIAHACFIASDLDQARRALKDDLYATDQAFLTGRDLEQTLAARGFTPQRVDAFITKVLKVLDGIAAAEEPEMEDSQDVQQAIDDLEKDLETALSKYPAETKEAVENAAKLMEYLVRGKEAQEKKRLDVERRVKVLEGMVKIGEVVGGVVRFLLSESS